MSGDFGCAINCIDGRAQIAVIEWVKFHGGVQYVDVITEPGADGVVSGNLSGDLDQIYRNTNVSMTAHTPGVIAIAGHHDCAGNPASNEEHREQISRAAGVVQQWYPSVRVVGLFVNEFGTIDVICDSAEGEAEIRSFL